MGHETKNGANDLANDLARLGDLPLSNAASHQWLVHGSGLSCLVGASCVSKADLATGPMQLPMLTLATFKTNSCIGTRDPQPSIRSTTHESTAFSKA
jgi:hypothetical protein